jgi:transcription-repair coupling factor (superfamily II helicase)
VAALTACAAGGGRAEVGGASKAGAAAVAGLAIRPAGRTVVVAATAENAESLALDLGFLFPHLPVTLLPAAEAELDEDGPLSRAVRSERLVALASLSDPDAGLVVVSAPAFLEELPAPDGPVAVIERGGRLDRDTLLAQLGDQGFARVAMVAAPGEVSVRGDIIDIYPWAAPSPVRVELFDDEVEDLRRFEVDTQRSVDTLDAITLQLGSGEGDARSFTELLLDDTPVVVIDPPRVRDRLVEVAFEAGAAPREIDAVLAAIARQPGGEVFPVDLGRDDADLSFHAIGRDIRPLATVLTAWLDAGRDVTLLCDGAGERDRLASALADDGLGEHPRLDLAVGRVTEGFGLPGDAPLLVHHHELIGRRAVRRSRPTRVVATRALDSVAELSEGDHVVHLLHGVGVYQGMKRLAREQGEEDFLVLGFAEGTTLYVPASRIDLVERFIGGDAVSPKLDRIGGRTWRRKKEKVAQACRDLASELLELQAKRASGGGFSHPPSDADEASFEATFPHDDTPDQRKAWDDVRRDMESNRSADRLVVGDVGFGKTEVAVRAAYKTVLAGKQCAVLVPTTILAEQHHETFRHRMAEEPVRVEALSRLRTSADAKAALKDLASGDVDIVIGTHRLLAKDVHFKDLGLVIVDEEQRFGVVHKERLKQLRAEVDVVTLSATPIPRTLHMAMSGLREISTIHTPPPGRLPVATRVTYDSDEVLGKALRHEINRGGQVFVLHNRVQSIHTMVDRVHGLVPHASCAFAHGQMSARELQHVIDDFAGGEIDVLVCTTIIESGIDIPRANTIVVTDAHRFGLADMHQLRGRVGRENRQAYAFFLVPKEKLPENADRRLKAIEEFSSLDSGLPIALRDLELRGAGNLLGAEQSGHILAVGYDTYCRLLKSAVTQSRGGTVEDEPGEIEVELGLTAFLPAEYVPDETQRMALLRRLAKAGKRKLEAVRLEMEDRFGELPAPAAELVRLFELRRLLRLAGVGSLLADGLGGAMITVSDEEAFTKRHPFRPDEFFLLSPSRIRVPWPGKVDSPTRRLKWLIERFKGARAPSKTR